MPKHLRKLLVPFFLLLALVFAIYGGQHPWPPAATTLASYQGQAPILIGAGFKTTNTSSTTYRSYVLFPSVVSEPLVITIRQINQAPVQVQITSFPFIALLAFLALCALATWWFFFRKGGSNVT